MRVALALALLVCLLATSAFAQTSTATGTGVGISSSRSAAAAVAISGQGGQGGTANGNGGAASSVLTVNNPANTTSSTNVSGDQTLRNVPTVFSPGLAAAGLETCLGSVSAGAGVVGFGGSFGTTVPDPSCAARLDARTLWSFGLKKAAVARLCLNPDINRAMPEVCAEYLPQPAYIAPAAYPGPGPLFMASPDTAVAAVAAVEPRVAVPDYTGGPIEVIDRKTGVHRICNDYDVTRQRCRVWAHGKLVAAQGR